jgi:hypothetical protein
MFHFFIYITKCKVLFIIISHHQNTILCQALFCLPLSTNIFSFSDKGFFIFVLIKCYPYQHKIPSKDSKLYVFYYPFLHFFRLNFFDGFKN